MLYIVYRAHSEGAFQCYQAFSPARSSSLHTQWE